MNKFQEFKKWVETSPKNSAVASLLFIPVFFLFRLAIDTQDVLENPLKEIPLITIISVIYAYVTYTTKTLRQNKQEVPHLTSTLGFSQLALSVKVIVVFVLLISLWILFSFHIENWGGVLDPNRQLTMQLVGIAFFIPIGILYILCGWLFSNPKHLPSSYLIYIPAFALSFWNANYSWRNPANPIPYGYEQFYWLVFRMPMLPLLIMLIPVAVWLVTVWSKLKQQSKLA
jgi:hypothetical protein